MDSTEKQYLAAICTFILLHVATATTRGGQWVATLPSYTSATADMSNVVVDAVDGGLFVCGTNVLLHLSSDLSLMESVSTGPVQDDVYCFHPSYPCTFSSRRRETNNHNQVLRMVHDLDPKPLLLVCGTVYRRLCQVRSVANLTDHQWIHPFNLSGGYTAEVRDVHSYFGAGHGDPRSHTLVTARTMARNYQDQHLAPFLTSIVLEKTPGSIFPSFTCIGIKEEWLSSNWLFQYVNHSHSFRIAK